MKQVLDAIDFARTAHQGQFDRGGRPYFEHVERVCIRTCSRLFELDPRGDKIDNQVFLDVAAAAALHDVVEDCDIGGDDLLVAGSPSAASCASQGEHRLCPTSTTSGR